MALKKNENKGDVELTLSQKKQSENGQIYDCNPYIVFIFVITALIHCILGVAVHFQKLLPHLPQ